jgi:hypothetical protein
MIQPPLTSPTGIIPRVFLFNFSGWGETESTWYVGHCWPTIPAPDDRWWLWSSWWNEDWQEKPKYSEKTCPSATLSTTNPTWPDLGSNPDRRGGKPATNRLSYGTATIARVLVHFQELEWSVYKISLRVRRHQVVTKIIRLSFRGCWIPFSTLRW